MGAQCVFGKQADAPYGATADDVDDGVMMVSGLCFSCLLHGVRANWRSFIHVCVFCVFFSTPWILHGRCQASRVLRASCGIMRQSESIANSLLQ